MSLGLYPRQGRADRQSEWDGGVAGGDLDSKITSKPIFVRLKQVTKRVTRKGTQYSD